MTDNDDLLLGDEEEDPILDWRTLVVMSLGCLSVSLVLLALIMAAIGAGVRLTIHH